jgi:hypothetical protein
MVALRCGFCELKGIIEVKKRGAYAASLKKIRRDWPKFLAGEDIQQHFKDKKVGDVDTTWCDGGSPLPHLSNEGTRLYSDDDTNLRHTRVSWEKTSQKLHNGKVKMFQYPEVISNQFRQTACADKFGGIMVNKIMGKTSSFLFIGYFWG